MKITNLNLQNNLYKAQTQTTEQKTEEFEKILEEAKNSGDNEKLISTCKQFESIFVNMLMKNMRKTVIDGGLTPKSPAREMFEGMLDEEIAKEVSKEQGIGLAELMYKQLSKNL